jgi:hypothetical protein
MLYSKLTRCMLCTIEAYERVKYKTTKSPTYLHSLVFFLLDRCERIRIRQVVNGDSQEHVK